MFQSPITEVYLLSVHSFTSTLVSYNKKFQSDRPLIHRLAQECDDLVRICMSRAYDITAITEEIPTIDLENLPVLSGKKRCDYYHRHSNCSQYICIVRVYIPFILLP